MTVQDDPEEAGALQAADQFEQMAQEIRRLTVEIESLKAKLAEAEAQGAALRSGIEAHLSVCARHIFGHGDNCPLNGLLKSNAGRALLERLEKLGRIAILARQEMNDSRDWAKMSDEELMQASIDQHEKAQAMRAALAALEGEK